MNLKDYINAEFVSALAGEIKKESKTFDAKGFKEAILADGWKKLELKERIRKLSNQTHFSLGDDYSKNIEILKPVAQRLNDSGVNALCLFYFPDYVQIYGLNNWDESMEALELFTEHSTGEFAIRGFFRKDFSKTLKQMQKWANHKNHHIRRLASEGSRPKLPWGLAVPELTNGLHTVDILEKLKNDSELYVRKSVANHLNDISKKFPNEALKLGSSWYGKSEDLNWIVKHGFRGLLKKGDAGALKVFGYKTDSKSLAFSKLKVPSKVKDGEDLHFGFEIESKKPQKLRLEFAVYFLRANNKHNKKVFLISEKEFLKGTHQISKKYSFKKITTRRYYKGRHHLSIIVNGLEVSKVGFELV